jgi:hypothetical protein
MYTVLQRLGLAAVILSAAIMLPGCSDPADENENPSNNNTPGELTQEEADVFMDRIGFTSSTKMTGTIPPVIKASLVKTDSKDTIYILENLKMPLRISHPASMELSGVFIKAENSSFYYDVPIDEEEESDTVAVVILEIEPDDQAAASDVPIEIIPYGPSKSPVDIIKRVIRVEEPSSECDLLIDGDTSDLEEVHWIWHSTTILDENESVKFLNSPSRADTAIQRPWGCCGTPPACPELKLDPATGKYTWVYDSRVTATTYYSIAYEGFSFYKNGTYTRISIELIKNFNPATTDWCSKRAGYNERETIVEYHGTHDYKPGNTSIIYITKNKKCDDPLGLCGYGSRPGAITQSCHLLVITASASAAEGQKQKEIRVYVRRQHIDKYRGHYFYT